MCPQEVPSGDGLRGRSQGEVSGGGLRGRSQGQVSGGDFRWRSNEECFLINIMLLVFFSHCHHFYLSLNSKYLAVIFFYSDFPGSSAKFQQRKITVFLINFDRISKTKHEKRRLAKIS